MDTKNRRTTGTWMPGVDGGGGCTGRVRDKEYTVVSVVLFLGWQHRPTGSRWRRRRGRRTSTAGARHTGSWIPTKEGDSHAADVACVRTHRDEKPYTIVGVAKFLGWLCRTTASWIPGVDERGVPAPAHGQKSYTIDSVAGFLACACW